MKMGRRLRCSSVTYRFRYAPSSRPAAAGPTAHFDRNESHVIYGTGHWSVTWTRSSLKHRECELLYFHATADLSAQR
jgi:hypothetical protein